VNQRYAEWKHFSFLSSYLEDIVQPLSNYPRAGGVVSMDPSLLAKSTKKILNLEVCLAIGNMTLSVFSELFMSQAEAAILFGGLAWFVAFIFL
jgi:hypothetical protein